jgi:transketolase
MRKLLADLLLKEMRINKDIYLLVGDLGYKAFDEHFKENSDRVINCGASEQAMMDMAVGLAYSGKIPFVYSITPFLIYRPFETLRTYINWENLPVKLLGSGRNQDYEHDGISHFADDVGLFLNQLPMIIQFWPQTKEDISPMFYEMVSNNKPSFISLKR